MGALGGGEPQATDPAPLAQLPSSSVARALVGQDSSWPAESDPRSRSLLELHHDLRQPLAAISALVSAAESQADVPETVRICLERIGEEARQLLAMCRSVLDRPQPSQTVSVGHVAFAVAESCHAATGCRIEFDVDHALAMVDEVGLRRAIWNLLDNACRAAGPDGRILVGVRHEAGAVVVSVADSGPGFGAAPAGAASLGLDIVRRFADEHGGAVQVGTGPLEGAVVSLVLPAFIDLSSSTRGTEDSPCLSKS